MKIKIIGMWGGFPKKGEACSGYLVEHEGYSVLVDCGSGVLMKLQEFIDLNEIHEVILSHYHYDHSSDVGAYLFSRLVNTQLGRVKRPLTIYGPLDKAKQEEYTAVPNIKFQEINGEKEVDIGLFRFSFLKTIHPVETYAMKITCADKSIVYTADTAYFPELAKFARGADLLIAECSLYEGMSGEGAGHMNAKEAGRLANEAGVRRTVLTHLPHFGDLMELVESAKTETDSPIELATPGRSFEL